MNIFDIFIAYVSWGNSGKHRPVLIIEQQVKTMSVFNITTQYENKNKTIRNKYFKIIDWQQAGLNQQSYVDTNTLRDLPKIAWKDKIVIGRLTESDIRRLFEFLQRNS